MIIKMQPKEFENTPLISAKDANKTDTDVYKGRVIIEFWCEEGKECETPAFAWYVDGPDRPDKEWIQMFRNGMRGAMRHIEDSLNRKKHSDGENFDDPYWDRTH